MVVRSSDEQLVAKWLGYPRYPPTRFTTKDTGVGADFVTKPAWQMVGDSYVLSVLTAKEREEAGVSLTTARAAWVALNAHFTAAHTATMATAAALVARHDDEHAVAVALVMLRNQ